MTRDEFLEIIEGSEEMTLKIHANDQWTVGKVDTVKSTFVKIINTDHSIRIVNFEKIDDICILSDAPAPAPAPAAASAPIPAPKPVSIPKSTDIDSLYNTARQQIRPALLLHENRRESIKKELKGTSASQGWNSAMNSYDNAVKNHCIDDKLDSIIAKLDDLYDEFLNAQIKIQLGDIFYETNDIEQAMKEYEEGHDYYNAAACAKALNDNNALLRYIAHLVLHADCTDDIIRTFFYIAANEKQGGFCANVIRKLPLEESRYALLFYGFVYMIYAYNRWEVIPEAYLTPGEESIQYMLELLTKFCASESFEEITADTLPIKAESLSSNEKLQGSIKNYNCVNKYGFIDYNAPENIYFRIEQVEDDALRELLCRTNGLGIKVNFTIGVGIKDKAADHITPANPIVAEEEDLIVHSGFISEYNDNLGLGRVQQDNKVYTFSHRDIIDPYLLRFIENNFRVPEFDVEFRIKRVKDKKVAYNIMLADSPDTDKVHHDYASYVSVSDLENFRRASDNIADTVSVYVPSYIPLKPWTEPVVTRTAPSAPVHPAPAASAAPPPAVEAAASAPKEFASKITPQVSFTAKSKDFFSTAEMYHTQMKDFAKAEEYYFKAIDAGENVAGSVANLITMYMRNNRCDEAMELLAQHKKLFTEEKYNNMLIQVIDKKKDLDLMCKTLERIIPITHKLNTKLHYMYRLAATYSKKGEFEKSIERFKQWKTLKNNSRFILGAEWQKFIIMESSVDRGIAMALYSLGKKDEAKEIASRLLRQKSDDLIARSIMDDTFDNPISQSDSSSNSSIYDDSDDYYDDDDDDSNAAKELPACALDRMKENDISIYFSKNSAVREKINEKGRFCGTKEDAEKITDDYMTIIRDQDYETQIKGWLALSTIWYDLFKASDDDKKCQKAAWKKCKNYMGRSLMCSGIAAIQSRSNQIETARYYLSLAMQLLHKKSFIFQHSQAILIYSHFHDEKKLSEQVVGKSNEYFSNDELKMPNIMPFSIKDLLMTTFSLEPDKAGINSILEKVYNSAQGAAYTAELLHITQSEETIQNAYEFRNLWYNAQKDVEKVANELRGLISATTEHLDSPAELEKLSSKIKTVLDRKLTFSKDEYYITKHFLRIIEQCIKLGRLYVCDDKIDTLNNIKEECDRLFGLIDQEPTDLSYDCIKENASHISTFTIEKLNEIYSISIPRLQVSCSPIVYFDKDTRIGQLTITVRNEGNVQRADTARWQVECESGARSYENPTSSIFVIKGGTKGEHIQKFMFTEEEIHKTSFAVKVSFDYTFFTRFETEGHASFAEEFSVNLANSSDFQPINNPFSPFANGGGTVSNDMFKGREGDIQRIIDMLQMPDGSVAKHRGIYMFGQKRTGKSSIMSYLEEKIKNAYPDKYIIVDYGSIGNDKLDENFESNFKYTLVHKISRKLRRKYRSIYDEIGGSDFFDKQEEKLSNPTALGNPFGDTIETISEHIGDRTLMIFIDEFTYIYEGIKTGCIRETFPHFWKAFLQNYNVCSIVIGMESMSEFVNDPRFTNDFGCMEPFTVSYLAEEGARELIQDPIRDENGESRFDEDALKHLCDITAGSAYLIMNLCSKLVDYMNATYTSRVSITMLESFLDYSLARKGDNNGIDNAWFEPQIVDPTVFGEDKERVRNDNMEIISFIAKNSNFNNIIEEDKLLHSDELSARLHNSTPEYLKKMVQRLIHRRVLIATDNGYKIWVQLLHKYYE